MLHICQELLYIKHTHVVFSHLFSLRGVCKVVLCTLNNISSYSGELGVQREQLRIFL